MLSLNEFEDKVRKNFAFLVNEYHFILHASEDKPFMYYVKYLKDNLMLRVGLAYRHDFIEINMFNDINKYTPTTQNFEHCISLAGIIKSYDKNYFLTEEDYEKLMPSSIGIDRSLELLSALLQKYGHDFLQGDKWSM